MATLNLKIVLAPTYDVSSMNVVDASTYPDDPPVVTTPTLTITPPGFNQVSIPFVPKNYNIVTSDLLGITQPGDIQPLPDGVYIISYSIAPAYINFTTISIMRVDQLMEQWDKVFMGLDMMECNQAVKKQAKVALNTIYLLIQGSIAAANNCAVTEAYKLYDQAKSMLASMMKKNCGCSGNNYI